MPEEKPAEDLPTQAALYGRYPSFHFAKPVNCQPTPYDPSSTRVLT